MWKESNINLNRASSFQHNQTFSEFLIFTLLLKIPWNSFKVCSSIPAFNNATRQCFMFGYNSGRLLCGARTHLEFERLMPKGANFAQAAHPPWVILAARPLHVWKTFYGYYQKSCHMNWESPILNRFVFFLRYVHHAIKVLIVFIQSQKG